MCSKGTLDLYCLECSRMISWRKEHVVIRGSYYDWHVAASCGCGEITDPEVLAMAREAFEGVAYRDLFAAQEEAMERVLGTPFHRALNERVRSMEELDCYEG